MIKGNLHSVESLGTLDGPGLRYVLFTQGCVLRCLFCHNPDTWKMRGAARVVTAEEMVEEIRPYIPYFKASGGGVTVSGGEPLLQMPFLTELFKALKAEGIHTCIDTSAGCANDSETFTNGMEELLKYTDLVLLDLKHIDNEKHIHLTKRPNTHILKFAEMLSERHQPIWVRHVLVPGLTDDAEDLIKLGRFINSLNNVEKFEILPYNQLGVHKWEALGVPYELNDVEPPSDTDVEAAYQLVDFRGMAPVTA
ncbi:pyruvate formate-lyase-activating protein [Salinicoccus bachuensis]|uniref:Pyruvate formate-lyase-activating enzyme n=1 Tax=Salinicoccus bachuensis TaxID=3136731 RepID=A0ABZ3CIF6_9STAP